MLVILWANSQATFGESMWNAESDSVGMKWKPRVCIRIICLVQNLDAFTQKINDQTDWDCLWKFRWIENKSHILQNYLFTL